MTAIRSVASLRYGMRLFGYLFAVLVVGGGLLALGLDLGYTPATDLLGSASLSDVSTTDLAAGVALSLLGSFVLFSGVFGLLHKLVADSVAAGFAESTPGAVAGTGTVAPGAAAGTGNVDEEPGEAETADDESTAVETSQGETTDQEPSEKAEPPTPTGQRRESATQSPETGGEPAESERERNATTDRQQSQTASGTGDVDGPDRRLERDEAPVDADPSLSEVFGESVEGDRVEPGAEEPTGQGQPPERPEPSATRENRDRPAGSGTEPVPETDIDRGETGTDPADEWESKEPQSKREPTPGEIAFGTSGGADETDDPVEAGDADDERDAAADDTDGDTGSGRSVGNASGTDPLADPDEE